MNVVWSTNALKHLSAIYEYISRDSERYAKRTVDRITSRSKQFGRFPELGAAVAEYRDPKIREVIEGAYRVIYRIDPLRIVVVAIIHSARQLPEDLSEVDE